MLCALNPFKMTLFWGLKKFPLRREIPALKDHLKQRKRSNEDEFGGASDVETQEVLSSLVRHGTVSG